MIENRAVTRSVEALMKRYGIKGEIILCQRNDTGHINDTHYVVVYTPEGTKREFMFQRVNTAVFTEPLKIMFNISKISNHLVEKYGAGSKETTEIMSYLINDAGENYTILDDGSFWRVNEFVVGVSYDQIDDPSVLHDTGYMFGHFQNMLSDLNAEELQYTIPDFHNTAKRFEAFDRKVKENPADRAAGIEKDIQFFYDYKEIADRLVRLQQQGRLPLRVTHNDTKYNNMLVNALTKEPICVIDLDTVMPGLAAHDFGDAIRCAANKSVEDEVDLSKVGLDKTYFEAFTKGFVTEAKQFLTEDEVESLALGALTITYELASRFLADYIDGDNYFKITRRFHNLDRARCQIQLAKDMMNNYDYMCATIKRYYQ
ncbi:MAG: aminoglycoside phosphotransferase family protein [Clostridiales bacterium]|nr:aminoglycoside phosphotransferase family protein [Clostridiales bacterium]